jgi:transcriptional regulator with XRE-family HTH domain
LLYTVAGGVWCKRNDMAKVKQPRDAVRLRLLGNWLRAAREVAGLSQSDLADAAGVPLPTLRNWEQGRREAGALSLVDIATACKADLGGLPVALSSPPEAEPTPATRGRPRKAAEPTAAEETPKKTRKRKES